MTDDHGDPKPPRRTRPSVDVPPSVLHILSSRLGQAPRISLRAEDADTVGAPPIDPHSDERQAVPEGRGSYQVLGEIARGGMGVVLRGHDTDLGRDVAMKVLHKDLADRPEVVQRFVEEAQIGGQLQHPGIVPVYELGLMADERPYFTMKLVKGRTLATLLAERETTAADRRRLIDVFESMCQTVAYAHSRGVIHRDLKPANVMVGAFGEVQVVDWGLAKVLPRGGVQDERRAQAARAGLTVLETVRSEGSSRGSDSVFGSVMGTPAYMPPEQASGHVDRLDERADVFALGAILCEILTGAPPYDGPKDQVLRQAALGELEPALARLDGCGADPELVKLSKHCLISAPAARPRNAGVVAQSVRRYLETQEERAHSALIEAAESRVRATQERKARRLTLALAGTVLVSLVVGGGGWIWTQQQRARRESEAGRRRRALETEVTAALGQADVFVARGAWSDARAAAERGLALAQGGEAGIELVRRGDELLAEIDSAVEESRLRAERAGDTARFLEELHEVRETIEIDPAATSAAAGGMLAQAYAAIFDAHGIALEAPEAGAEELVRRGMGSDVVVYLDTWSAARRSSGDERGALHLLDVAHLVDPDPVRADLREAVFMGDLEMLRSLAAGDLTNQPPATLELLAISFARFEDLQASLDVLRQAVRIHPQDASLHRHLAETLAPPQGDAMTLEQLASHREAAAHAWSAFALQPDSSVNLTLLGRILDRIGESQRAVDLLQAAVDLRPDSTFAHLALGVALSRLEDSSERALRELRAVRKQGVPNIRLYWSLFYAAEIQMREGDLVGAIADLEEAMLLQPEDLKARGAWIRAMVVIGDLDILEKTFEEEAPKIASVYNSVAWALANLDPELMQDPQARENFAERGVAYAREALRLGDRDPEAWNTLAVASLRARDFQGALGAVQRSIELSGGEGTLDDWFTMATCQVELGEIELGRLWYERGRAWLEASRPLWIEPDTWRLADEAAARLGLPAPSR